MGRWGHRMFEGDQDLDLAIELEDGSKAEFAKLIHHTDMIAPNDVKAFYQTAEYKGILDKLVEEQRKILDESLADKLFEEARKGQGGWCPNYKVIVLAALIMRTGATMKKEDIEYIRTILPEIPTRSGYALPFCDEGFRNPGKVQFQAALDNYEPGIPRDFATPSCFKCGKVQADIGSSLMRCSKCKMAHYCNNQCQADNWKEHKKICFKDGMRSNQAGFAMLNV